MEEEWRQIDDTIYEVSSYGKVKNSKTGRIMKQKTTSKGYLECGIVVSTSKSKTFRVHRLVAIAFISKEEDNEYGEPRNTVDHIDDDKKNNYVSNLRWCSAIENLEFKYGKKCNRHTEEYKLEQKIIKEELRVKKLKISNIIAEKNKLEKIKNMKYGSREVMMEAICKKITVDGKEYKSCGEAARYIVEQEAKLGNYRNKDTISKELRRYLQGKRSEWFMYKLYSIGY